MVLANLVSYFIPLHILRDLRIHAFSVFFSYQDQKGPFFTILIETWLRKQSQVREGIVHKFYRIEDYTVELVKSTRVGVGHLVS